MRPARVLPIRQVEFPHPWDREEYLASAPPGDSLVCDVCFQPGADRTWLWGDTLHMFHNDCRDLA